MADSEVQDAIKNEGKVHRKLKIVNTDRATLVRIGGAIAKVHGDSGFAGEISIDFEVLLTPFQPFRLVIAECLPYLLYSPSFIIFSNCEWTERPVSIPLRRFITALQHTLAQVWHLCV